MCGIVGAMVFDGSSFQITESYLARMRDKMSHRGPDGAGIWIAPSRKVGFGHRRLSIIDLSTEANQPMSNEDETIWVTFNGEIYNHAEIRRELEKLGGHRWKTDHSDTEVILHAYEQWGIDCLHRFRGMFGIALWDSRARKLWLIRDRVGIKPLYYSVHHGRITFASEIKALLADPEQAREVDEEALFHYLSFLATPAPQTLFAGIRKLPNGCWLRVDEHGNIEEQRYWEVWDHVQPLTAASEDEIAERILAELRTAVTLRKVSDVPVGVFLSGGIDSSTNAALFAEGESRPIKTFTIGYDADYASNPSELPFARSMAQRIGAEHHERLLKIDDLLDFLPRMVQLQDEPIADPVCVPVYYVSELARRNGVTVCQLGEGSDELFCGYPWWQGMLRIQRWNTWPVPRWIKRLGVAGLNWLGKGEDWRTEWLRRASVGLPIFWSGAEAFMPGQKAQLLGPSMQKRFAGRSSWEAVAPLWRRFQEKAWDRSFFHWMTYSDLHLRLPELLLMRVDKMSMGVALECRVPFLDHKFVELALSIPAEVKTRNGHLKPVLKRAVRGLIPDELIDRPKQGFGVPVHEWFLQRLGERTRRDVTQFCKKTDYLDAGAVNRFLDRGRGPQSWYLQSWYLLNLALWWKEYLA